MIIIIDPGHGGSDAGAIGVDPRNREEVLERDLNLALARDLRATLEVRGHTVNLTHTGDGLGLTARARAADGAHLLLSIHHNAAASPFARGFEILVDEEGGEIELRHRQLASVIAIEAEPILRRWGVPLRTPTIKGDESYAAHRHLTVLEAAVVPACLLEVCFVTNPLELIAALEPCFRQELATAIAAALEAFGKEILNVI